MCILQKANLAKNLTFVRTWEQNASLLLRRDFCITCISSYSHQLRVVDRQTLRPLFGFGLV